MVEGFKIPNLFDEYKTIFLGKQGKRWNPSKTFRGGSKFIMIIVFSNVLNVEYSAVKYSTGDNVILFVLFLTYKYVNVRMNMIQFLKPYKY